MAVMHEKCWMLADDIVHQQTVSGGQKKTMAQKVLQTLLLIAVLFHQNDVHKVYLRQAAYDYTVCLIAIQFEENTLDKRTRNSHTPFYYI